MYVLDSDFLIHAYRYDFPPNADKDGFWDWLNNLGVRHRLAIPQKVFDEIERGTDGLSEFLKNLENIHKEPTKNAMLCLPTVMKAYGNNISQEQLEILNQKADPYLAAHGLAMNATVVTNEVPSQNEKTNPEKKKLPDICLAIGVNCIRYPRFLWSMRS